MSRRIIVHSLEQARAAVAVAAALDTPIILQSAAGAAGYAGPLWWQALIAEATREHAGPAVEAVLDCGEEAGMALGALRAGLKRLRFTGDEGVCAKLEEIAAALGATIESGAVAGALDLGETRDPARLCRDFLAGNRTGD